MSDDISELERKLALGKGVRILKTDPCGLIALEKPPGIKSHPNDGEASKQCLINGEYDMDKRCYHHLSGAGCFEEVFLLHRLDSATSGVILISTNHETQEAAVESFKRKRVKKLYHAIVKGRPGGVNRIWSDKIERRDKGHSRSHVRVKSGDDLMAETEYNILRMDGNRFGLALLLLNPITGRTHQLRFQCKKHGHPILGDRNYGDFPWNRRFAKISGSNRLFLHATSIEIDLFKGDRRMTFTVESEIPDDFDRILSFNKELQQKILTVPSEFHQIQQRIGTPPPTCQT